MNETGIAAIVGNIMVVLYIVVWLSVYCLPVTVSVFRQHPRQNAIGLLNLLVGWTIVGWFGALIWTILPFEQPNTVRLPRSRPWLVASLWLLAGAGGLYLFVHAVSRPYGYR